MAFALFAVNEGFLDDVEIEKIGGFEAALYDYLRADQKELLAKINKNGDYNDEIAEEMRKALEHFKAHGAW